MSTLHRHPRKKRLQATLADVHVERVVYIYYYFIENYCQQSKKYPAFIYFFVYSWAL